MILKTVRSRSRPSDSEGATVNVNSVSELIHSQM